MKIRLAKKIMSCYVQFNSKIKTEHEYWRRYNHVLHHTSKYWCLKIDKCASNNHFGDHRITKAISLTSKYKKHGNTK